MSVDDRHKIFILVSLLKGEKIQINNMISDITLKQQPEYPKETKKNQSRRIRKLS